MQNRQDIIGIGWAFPPRFDREAAAPVMVSDIQDIQESLHILLSTSLGERVMQPLYGCNLSDYQFEAVNTTFLTQIESIVERAILYYEPRIVLEKLDITAPDSFDLIEGVLRIFLEYTVSGTNTRFNLVYDLYLREADNNPILKPVLLNQN
jgi:uncharacterized protein